MPRRDVLTQISRALWEGEAMTRNIRGLKLTVVSQGLILTIGPSPYTDAPSPKPPELQQLYADRWTQVGTHRLRLETTDDEHTVWARPWMQGDRFTSPHSERRVSVRKRLARDGVSIDDRDRAIVVLAHPSRTHSNLVFDGEPSKTKSSPEEPSEVYGAAPSRSAIDTGPTTPRATIVGVIHQANQRLEIRVAQSKRFVVMSATPENGDPYAP